MMGQQQQQQTVTAAVGSALKRMILLLAVMAVMAAVLALGGGAALADPGNGNGAQVIHTDGGTKKVTTPSCNVMKNNTSADQPPIHVHPDDNDSC